MSSILLMIFAKNFRKGCLFFSRAGFIIRQVESGSKSVKLTPMMRQYRQIKSGLPPDAILLFRLGDFYEMFFEDAQEGARILNIALTKRGESCPMCGIPYHAAEGYLSKLLQAGRKVAICDQMEEPRPGKIVKREVTQILSPGTHFDEKILSADRNNFLAAVYPYLGKYGFAVADLTTGDFFVTETESESGLLTELERQRPAELIIPSEANELRRLLVGGYPNLVLYEDWVFMPETSFYTVKDHFHTVNLDGFGLTDHQAAVGAAGAMLHYLSQYLRRDIGQLTRISFYESSNYLVLDGNTLRNLEILEPLNRIISGGRSLFAGLNKTSTPMGARMLRGWLSQPLADAVQIAKRQQAVAAWLEHSRQRELFREILEKVRDLERVLTRLNTVSGNARDMVQLAQGLEQLPATLQLLESLRSDSALINQLADQITPMPEVIELIQSRIVDEPPISTKEGGMIRAGVDADLDELRQIMHGGKNWVAKLQQEEIERTGIPNLKVRFNSVFGYYIEVTKTHLDKIPADYIRRQTIANGERFATPELKEWEGKILGAEERVKRIEYDLFVKLRESVLEELVRIQRNARVLAQLDVLASFAETAWLYNYICPTVKDEGIISIRNGRHPVLDQTLESNRFVPNDCELNHTTRQLALITGPNMGGKSTYIRQTALLTLMAQAGSFIPAQEARIDVVDRIFTRIGASDDLARGQSTFMVEMSETASILNNATSRSLVILDEIGRGTSTFDGLSLAWSIVEYLHNQCGALTLFATHYHELTELEDRLERVFNLNAGVREYHGQIVFLHQIFPGASDKSYGIQVAKLAGVPESVLKRAREVLANLEESELTPLGADGVESGPEEVKSQRLNPRRQNLRKLSDPGQLDLFSELGL